VAAGGGNLRARTPRCSHTAGSMRAEDGRADEGDSLAVLHPLHTHQECIPDRFSVGVLRRTWTSSLMRWPSRDPRREMSAQLEEDAPRVGTPASKAAVEECYRAEHARLWRSLLLFSGDADLASDAVRRRSRRRSAAGARSGTSARGCGGRRSRSPEGSSPLAGVMCPSSTTTRRSRRRLPPSTWSAGCAN
jgi:hypothetical protein